MTTAVVLASKNAVHRFVKGTLTDAEVNDGLVFAIATVVIWPQLPDRPMGPYGALNPHALWLFVILVLAIGACGYVLTRVIGPRFGLPLAGFASGFVSSTATIGSMGGLAQRHPEDLWRAVAGATLSTVATFAQLALLLAVASPPDARGHGAAASRRRRGRARLWHRLHGPATKSGGAGTSAAGRAFSVRTALILAVTLALMMVVSAWLRAEFGETGIRSRRRRSAASSTRTLPRSPSPRSPRPARSRAGTRCFRF